MEKYQLDTMIEFQEDYIKAIIRNENSPHTEDATDLAKKRQTLVDYIQEVFGIEDYD